MKLKLKILKHPHQLINTLDEWNDSHWPLIDVTIHTRFISRSGTSTCVNVPQPVYSTFVKVHKGVVEQMPINGFEPLTLWLQIRCSANWAKSAMCSWEIVRTRTHSPQSHPQPDYTIKLITYTFNFVNMFTPKCYFDKSGNKHLEMFQHTLHK